MHIIYASTDFYLNLCLPADFIVTVMCNLALVVDKSCVNGHIELICTLPNNYTELLVGELSWNVNLQRLFVGENVETKTSGNEQTLRVNTEYLKSSLNVSESYCNIFNCTWTYKNGSSASHIITVQCQENGHGTDMCAGK